MRSIPLLHRFTARVLAQLLFLTPVLDVMSAYAAEPTPAATQATEAASEPGADEPAPVLTPTNVVVNRTVPTVSAPPTPATFSAEPGDAEFFSARVFPEPLLPMGQTTPEENKALAQAVGLFAHTTLGGNLGALQGFADANPGSAWRAPLLLNLGTFYKSQGYFSKALESWQKAWDLTKGGSELAVAAVADGALGQLSELHMKLGHAEQLQALLDESDGRNVRGSASERVYRAKEGLWQLENQMHFAMPSIVMAFDRIQQLGQSNYQPDPILKAFHPTRMGVSLTESKDLADSLKLEYQMAFRDAAAAIPLPAVVHLKVEHFAAVIEKSGDKYLLDDAFLGGRIWISEDALRAESSGYFLIPGSQLPVGWRAVDAEEARARKGIADLRRRIRTRSNLRLRPSHRVAKPPAPALRWPSTPFNF